MATVARVIQDLIVAVPTGTTAVDEVVEGAIVKAIYIELWSQDDGNDGSEVVVLSKQTAGQLGPTFTEMNALGTWNEKKNIFFTHQGLTSNDGITGPLLVMRAWYKIPKSKQRFGLGDRLTLTMASNGAQSVNFCGFAIYKEYS